MPIDFDRILEKQLEGFPKKLKPFLHLATPASGIERTWEYFAYAYERAFDIMAEEYCRVHPNQTYLLMPLMHLARHSMELSLKNALNKCNEVCGASLSTDKHFLLPLYDRLDRFLIDYGMIGGADDWAMFVRKVIVHIDKVDTTGEVFRYPTNLSGNPFESYNIDIEALITAHHHVTLLAEATVAMLDDLERC